ncbi:hypothetical protein FQZ97_1122910 [compost metagenome]
MAQALEGRVRAPGLQPWLQIGSAQVGPAHHTEHLGVLVGQPQQEVGLLGQRARLHGHHAVHARGPHGPRVVGRQAVAPQRWHGLADPGKLRRAVTPEVLVGVDLHAARGWNSYCFRDSGFISIEKPGARGGM